MSETRKAASRTRALKPMLVAAAALLVASPAAAMTIIPTFDSSITSLGNASVVEAAFNQVAKDYSGSFSNPITVYVGVSWGSVAGQALPSSAVGASSDNLYGYYSYSQVKNWLTASAATNPADTSLASAVKHLPTTTPAGPSQYVIPSAEAKALGLISGSQTSKDGYIGFTGTPANFDFNPTDGITAGTYDFETVAGHELAEVLGRVSGMNNSTPTWRTPYDLFRYKWQGALSYGYNDHAYFSINGGATNLKAFNYSSSGGDRSDWMNISGVNDISNAFVSTGQRDNLSAVDLTSLDVMGYGGSNLGNSGSGTPNATAFALVSGPNSVPEPASWSLMIMGFGLLGATLRERRLAQA